MFSKISIILIFLLAGLTITNAAQRDTISLQGDWDYRLIGAPASIPGEGVISLPSTLDESHKSVFNPEGENTSQLRREFSFTGKATYSKKLEIPREWKGKNIDLFLERTRPSVILIDGDTVGYSSNISSPQIFNLSNFLSPGSHSLEITVNNADSIPPIIARSSNASSESTQTNWNGILGEMILEAKNPFHIKKVEINNKNIKDHAPITVFFSEEAPENFLLTLKTGKDKNSIRKQISKGTKSVSFQIPLDESMLWSANRPTLYNLEFEIEDNNRNVIDSYLLTTGFRNFSTEGKTFTINGNPLFLRGTINAAVFPLTGYAPTDVESWVKYFSVLKDYGINHVRFHSWTPPGAAFKAADSLGIYLLVELPIWGELDRDLKMHNRFLQKDMKGIMDAYSNHPSFVMFSPGNELWGDIRLMGEYMEEAKRLNPNILATYGSNIYLGMNGQIGKEDFLIASKTKDEMENTVRGSVSFADSPTGGLFNSTYPNSEMNVGKATEKITVPVISHEVGQYQTYPDFSQIPKYTGNLKPDNLKEFERRAREAGTYRKNKDYSLASGKWAAKLYKAEMEMALRSPGLGGYQLFGLQDYPGQGTALVGILDAFMDSKGYTTTDEWKNSASDISVLAEFPRFTFSSGETVDIPIVTVNFTENPDTIISIEWNTEFSSGNILPIAGSGVIETESAFFKIPEVDIPKKMTFRLNLNQGKINNEYEFWVYPKTMQVTDNIELTSNLDNALNLLKEGKKVILTPDSATMSKAYLDPLFVTDFWNYRMFRTICDEMNLTPSPGTLGLLVNNGHPALSKFPSDIHTDWQWFSIVNSSHPLIIDRLPKDVDPIIEVIDNVERNFRLALLLECNVGKGKLMILMSDPDKFTSYPEGKWFMQSIKEYMSSNEFKPSLTLTPDQVVNLLTKPSNARLIKELKNETYDSNWD